MKLKPPLITGYRKTKTKSLSDHQYHENKQLEAHRSSIEKCFAHFKNRFERFNGQEPFFYNQEIFELILPIALALDNLTIFKMKETEEYNSHPFFDSNIVKWWDFPSIEKGYDESQISEESIMGMLEKRTKKINNLFYPEDEEERNENGEARTNEEGENTTNEEVEDPIKFIQKDLGELSQSKVKDLDLMITKYNIQNVPSSKKEKKKRK
jgi:hypothetical protein